MTVSAIAIILTGVCTMLLFYSILKNQIFDDLKANAHVVSMIDLDDISQQMDDRLSADGLRITLIAADGTVLYDSAEDVSKMGNHGDRAEFVQAMSEGEGIRNLFQTHVLLCHEDGRRNSSSNRKRKQQYL